MLDLRTVIEWSQTLREQSARSRAQSHRLRTDYKWFAFQFEQFKVKNQLPQGKPRQNEIGNLRSMVLL
jgi:hypothetical protein